MAEYEKKFIIINKKHLAELNNAIGSKTSNGWNGFLPAKPVLNLLEALDEFKKSYEANVKKFLDQQYYVCNQDEPYAKKIIDIILSGENKKQEEK